MDRQGAKTNDWLTDCLEPARCCQEPWQCRACFSFVLRHFENLFENGIARVMLGERLTHTAHVQPFFALCRISLSMEYTFHQSANSTFLGYAKRKLVDGSKL